MNEFDILLRSPGTLALLASNIGFSIAAFGNVRLLDRLIYDVGRIRRFGEWWRMVTSGFIHGDPFHLLINMYALYIFGPFVEAVMSTGGFLLAYFACLIAGSLWTWMDHFRDTTYRALGASGAISGITTAGAMFIPFATIHAFFILPMPMIVFALCYIGWSAWASHAQVRDGIGHGAHLGGALMGVVVVCLFWPGAVEQMWQQFLATLPTSL